MSYPGWPIDTLRRIARGWLVLGLVVFGFVTLTAAAHYIFGVPVHERTGGHLAPPGEVLLVFMVVGGGGLLFAIAGFTLLRHLGCGQRQAIT